MTQSIKKFSNLFAIMLLTSFLAACATAPTETSSSSTIQSDVVGGIYVGTDTVEMLAIDVPDRVFFAYDSYSLAASAQTTLNLSLIHISEPTRLGMISYAVFCLK